MQRGFSSIATVLGEPLSLTATLDAVAQAAAEALGGDFTADLMPRLTAGSSWPARSVYPRPSRASSREACLRRRASSRSGSEGRVIAAPALEGDTRFGREWTALAREAGRASLLAAPLESTRSERHGVVLVCFPEEHRFTDDDRARPPAHARRARRARP